MNNFKDYSKYYDLFYKDKNYKVEANFIINLIKKYKPKSHTILELGSGSGSHANFLCKKNYQVTGIEQSEEMVNYSLKKNIPNFRPVVGNITNFKLNKKFDIAISMFHVISYLTNNNDLFNCFKLVNNHLNKDGLFIFDTWYSPAVYFQKPKITIKRINNKNYSITRISEPSIIYNNNIVNVNFEIIVNNHKTKLTSFINEAHPMRHFSYPEIELLANSTGFELIRSTELITDNNPSENTWGVLFILKKI